MPRINTKGVTDARQEDPNVLVREEVECPGNSSETSTDSKTTGTEKSNANDRKPVPSTEHRSTETAGNSTASSADGRTRGRK